MAEIRESTARWQSQNAARCLPWAEATGTTAGTRRRSSRTPAIRSLEIAVGFWRRSSA